MARTANPTKKKTTTGGEPRHRSVVWLSGLACGALVAVAPGVGVLSAVLLAPGLLAIKLDQDPGRPMARAVATFGLAGCVQPIITLWNSGQSFQTAMTIVADPSVLAFAWGSAAAGWLLSQVAPLAIRAAMEAASLARTARLRAARARLAETWGLEATSDETAAP